ncbi:hypothetical protein M1M18_gp050 [Halorubrum virus Serpecor1]|uniref:Uncharacterized protein n=1 Tax=Halorubrum virus Serpecor1 TaxID=2721757 RepID=A0A6G9RY24_9CAUD|nr:hypothetical protein M1M18_gp050 [Halorubrum virus Serpecor1]QIR31250.1 hypothetical protein HrrSp1_440 [Halorubrum virus Serpecor1]
MSALLDGLAVFGVIFLSTIVLLPVFLLQKEISEKRTKDQKQKLEMQLENERRL